MVKYVLLIAAIVAVPLTAQPLPAPAAPTQATAEKKVDPLDKVVCRSEETSGSRLKKHKVCATVREWQEQQQENRDALELQQQRGQSLPRSG